MSPARSVYRKRRSAARAALLLLFGIVIAVLSACSGAPPRRPVEEPPPPPPRTPPAVSERPAPAPFVPRPADIAGTRFLRVRIEEGKGGVTLSAETVRAWDADGRLAAEGSGDVSLDAVGNRIRFGGTMLLGGNIDVAGHPEIRLEGRRVGGRLRVSARNGKLLVIVVIPLETYVSAVISRETPPLFHPEALAAQAIATRTYALDSAKKPKDPSYDVVGSVEDQVFEGIDDVAAVFRDAALETRGMVLLYGGEYARTVFHSTCGGRTETAANAWGKDVPYLRSLVCEDCTDSPVYRWEYRMSEAEGRRVARAMGTPPGGDLRFSISEWTSTGRAARVRIVSGGVSRETQAAVFRRTVGYSRVRSLKMTIVPVAGGWLFSGHGYGHGVGMCQFGANRMAKTGKGYREILARYYPGTELVRESP